MQIIEKGKFGSFSATSTSSTNGGTITVDLSGKTHSLMLAGGGQQVSPLALDFGPVGIGSTANISTTVTNHGQTNITGWAGGAVGAPFSGSQDCNIPGGLPPGGTCHFYYTFQPTSAGSFSATSNVADSFGNFSIQLHIVEVFLKMEKTRPPAAPDFQNRIPK